MGVIYLRRKPQQYTEFCSSSVPDDVFRAHDQGRRPGERDYAGMWRREEEWTAEEKVDGGDTGGNGDGPGAAERSGEELER